MDTQMKDRSDFIVRYGENVVLVLATADLSNYELFVWGNGLPTPAQNANYSARGLTQMVGTMGLVLGEFLAHFYVEIPTAHAAALGTAYRQLTSAPDGAKGDAVDWLRQKLTADDSTDWLERLHSLIDPREAN